MKPTLAIYGIQDRADFAYPSYTHDHSVCVMEAGRITHYLQLERWTRRKYDNQMHLHIEAWMEQDLVPFHEEADLVFVNSFVGNSFLSKTGRIRFDQGRRSRLTTDVIPGFAWVESKKWTGTEHRAFAIDHELAHVCANLPFYGPFRENSLLVHFDGGASLGNFSAFLYRKGRIEVLECHWKLSHLSKFFNDNALTFAMLNHGPGEHCAVPGKLMGFATLGTPRAEIMDWLTAHGYFKDIWQDPSGFYRQARDDFGWEGQLGDTRDSFLQDLAACFQQLFEEGWLGHLQHLQEQVRADHLYLSGGCALNIVANTKIVNAGWFDKVFIPPCPGDSGLAIGAAAFLEWKKHGRVEQHPPFLNNVGLTAHIDPPTPAMTREIAACLAQGQIIGVCNGHAEVGPRALGNRSILARPDSPELAQKVSMTCKGREWYRPIAPVMLKKNAQRFTVLESVPPLSRYMLLDFAIEEKHRQPICGVVHANGTSRIQTIFKREDHPFLFDLLSCLDEVYDIPALINTSFNRKGEPMVHTHEQALHSAIEMGLDAVVLNNKFHLLRTPTSI